MTDTDLIGYELSLLDAGDRAAAEKALAADPDAARRLAAVRRALAPLAADRDPPEPPPGLAVRAIGRVAELVVTLPRAAAPPPSPRRPPDPDSWPELTFPPARGTDEMPVPADGPDTRAVGMRFRPDLIVAAGIGLLAVGLVASGIGRLRSDSLRVACHDNLRVLHSGLALYSDRHGGNFPQVGVEPYESAGKFEAALKDAGVLPAGFTHTCPAAVVPAGGDAVRYAYTLGYQGPNGAIVGLRKAGDDRSDPDQMPVAADYPTQAAAPDTGGPVSHHPRGQNVLFVGGNVRFTPVGTVGPNGDNIYLNKNGIVAAGLDRTDAVLGRAGDRP